MGTFSRNKGKRGEREVVSLLQSSLDAVVPYQYLLKRNTTQSDGGGMDIIGEQIHATAPFPFSIEVKFVENMSQSTIDRYWQQTIEQTNPHQIPVLFYRSSRTKWRVVTLLRIDLIDGAIPAKANLEVSTFLLLFGNAFFCDNLIFHSLGEKNVY
jgi:hypothetical protein